MHSLHLESVAIRSLGVRADVLSRADISDLLVQAVCQHANGRNEVQWHLLPVALQHVPLRDAACIIADLSHNPPSRTLFASRASGRMDEASAAPGASLLRTNADIAVAVAMQRIADTDLTIGDRCAMLADIARMHADRMLHVMPWCDPHARQRIAPRLDSVVRRLAPPERHDLFWNRIAELHRLSLDVSLPAACALAEIGRGSDLRTWMESALAFAHALREHGTLFVAFIDAMHDRAQRAVLPLPPSQSLAEAIRNLALVAPDAAVRVAYAIHRKDRDALLRALLDAPPFDALNVATAIPPQTREDIVADETLTIPALAANDGALAFIRTVQRLTHMYPLIMVALAAISSNTDHAYEQGISMLSRMPDAVRMLLPLMRSDVRKRLERDPRIFIARADIDASGANRRTPFKRERR